MYSATLNNIIDRAKYVSLRWNGIDLFDGQHSFPIDIHKLGLIDMYVCFFIFLMAIVKYNVAIFWFWIRYQLNILFLFPISLKKKHTNVVRETLDISIFIKGITRSVSCQVLKMLIPWGLIFLPFFVI